MAPREAVDLLEVARLAAEHAAPLIREQACAIELAVEDGLPAVPGDFAQLLQTADNLVANAIRYGCTAKGMSVTIEVRRDGDRAARGARPWRRHRTGTSAPPNRALLPGRHRPQPRQRRHRGWALPSSSISSNGTGARSISAARLPGHDGRGPPAVRLNSAAVMKL